MEGSTKTHGDRKHVPIPGFDFRALPQGGKALSISRTGYLLSASLAVVAAFAAAATAFVPGVLRGPSVMNGSARGTALVVLLVAVPALAIAMWFAGRGSARAQIVWLGAVGYILYNSTLFLFMTPFNQLFLLYVAMLSLAIWSAAILIRSLGVESFRERFSPKLPVRAIAIYALAIVGLRLPCMDARRGAGRPEHLHPLIPGRHGHADQRPVRARPRVLASVDGGVSGVAVAAAGVGLRHRGGDASPMRSRPSAWRSTSGWATRPIPLRP